MALAGLVAETLLAAAYLAAARRRSPRGRRWPRRRTWCFLAGVAVLVVALQPPLASFDDVLWVHVVQHLLAMMVAPPLLVLGAPLTLLLRTLPARRRGAVVSVLRDPGVHALSAGRWSGAALTADYHATMAVYLLTPLYGWSLHHEALHVAAHAYFVACGVLFWLPVVGADPVRWRPTARGRRRMVGLGLVVSPVLGLVLVERPGVIAAARTLADVRAAGWVLIAGGVGLTALGLLLVAARERPRRTRRARLGPFGARLEA